MSNILMKPGSVVRLSRTVAAPGFEGNLSSANTVAKLPKHTGHVFKPPDTSSRVLGIRWPGNYGPRIVRSIANIQVRMAHTDVSWPDFSPYRRDSTQDPRKLGSETEGPRKVFTWSILGVGSMIGIMSTKSMLHTMVEYKCPNRSELAKANTEIDLSAIHEGKSSTFLWQGKPVFCYHRTQRAIDEARATPMSELRDPQRDEDRVKDPKWLIAIGVCTHLGCVPTAGVGDYGAYFCPCHGSHYDTSGRIRKGPAPLNLEIPPYYFIDENSVFVGLDAPDKPSG